MMTRPLFSVCIPNFNYARYLVMTIQSVLDQSYQNFEIIVADNASTDNSVEAVRSFRDERIQLVENCYNIGFSPNLDKATGSAIGDYFILLSSDDIMKQGALEEYAQVIQEHDGLNSPLVVMSACDVIDGQGNIIGAKKSQTGDVQTHLCRTQTRKAERRLEIEQYGGIDILKGLLSGTFQPAGQFLTTCYSKRLYQKVDGYRSVMSVLPDAYFSHKILFENPKVIYVNKSLFAYRVHAANNLHQHESMANIKFLTDNYLFTQLYSEAQLSKVGLTGLDLKKAFIENHCLVAAFYAMLRGNFRKWLHSFTFGLASYPELMIRRPLFYALLVGFPFIPLFRLLYRFKRKW
jgi:glycosyltransferase involved in cell wall biosynthesis